jgi:hypothetical protein
MVANITPFFRGIDAISTLKDVPLSEYNQVKENLDWKRIAANVSHCPDLDLVLIGFRFLDDCLRCARCNGFLTSTQA